MNQSEEQTCLSATDPHTAAAAADSNSHQYPYQLAGGAWCVAHDEQWNPIVIDDMDGIDPSQFQNNPTPDLSLVPFIGPTDCRNNQTPLVSSDPLILETGDSTVGSAANDVQVVGASDRPSQNVEWDPSNCWSEPMVKFGAGVSGLTNMGNTCFLNAGLQCLLHNPALVRFFVKTFPKDDCHRNLSDKSLTSFLADLFIKFWTEERCESDHTPIRPTDFKESLSQSHVQFRDFRQHDCQEFLALLLGTLQEQLTSRTLVTPVAEECRSILELKKIESASLSAPFSLNDSCAVGSGTESSTDTSSVSSKSSSVDMSTDSTYRSIAIPSGVESFPAPVVEFQTLNNLILQNKLTNFNKTSNGQTCSSSSFSTNTNNSVNSDTSKPRCDQQSGDMVRVTLNDLSKQMKVANSNLKADDSLTNNQLRFNSSKFPKANELPKQDVVDNLGTDLLLNDLDKSSKSFSISSLKRSKTVNVDTNGQISDSSGSNPHTNSSIDYPPIGEAECKRIKTSPEVDSTMKTVDRTEDQFTNQMSDAASSEGSDEWDAYLERNQSVIVDTFHGQFRSTVTCAKCQHVSVTFEPFMYLPVPLPHALEKQVIVTFIASSKFSYGCRSAPVRYLIEVHKYDRLGKVVTQLKSLLRAESQPIDEESKIVIAEVKDNCVERIVDESMLLRFADDKNLYAFELPPIPSFASSSDSLSLTDPTPPDSNEMDTSQHFESSDALTDIPNLEPCDLEGMEAQISPTVSPIKTTDSNDWPCSQDSGIEDDHRDNRELRPFEIELPTSEPLSRTEAYVAQTTSHNADSIVPVLEDCIACCVCLDSKPKDELVGHPNPCSCVICPACLARHLELNPINQTDRFHCPTCSAECTKAEFLPLEKPCLHSPVKTITVPIIFRVRSVSDESGTNAWNANEFKIISHPILLQVPNQMTCSQLYESVDAFVPFPLPYSLRYVSTSGQKCSRCIDWSSNAKECTGCEIARIGSVSMTYSDAIAVEFDSEKGEQLDLPEMQIIDHESVSKKRPVEELKLEDCIKAFHENELLDEENPWYCPSCHSNQRAHKSLSIWRSPPTLMVYLKRFIFHDMMPIKIDDPVSFPLQLQLDHFVDNQQCDLKYNLEALVCHTGGVSAGHYTAYAKHCITGQWLYCNDSSITSEQPSLTDGRAYILFYRRSDDRLDPNIIRELEAVLSSGSANAGHVLDKEMATTAHTGQ